MMPAPLTHLNHGVKPSSKQDGHFYDQDLLVWFYQNGMGWGGGGGVYVPRMEIVTCRVQNHAAMVTSNRKRVAQDLPGFRHAIVSPVE